MEIEINNLTKMSFNVYNTLHWAKKKKFKDNLRILTSVACNKSFKGGYSLNFQFYFKGKRLDTINVFHYCKIIEDKLFAQDKDNRQICVNVDKGTENKCIIQLKKINDVQL
jgi:hypothetical protein